MENTINPASPPQNPLSKYFRQAAIHVKLPSNGKYWEEGALELPITGELPIFPMTARDEVTLRTPDGLLNGSSVVEIIQSCCPGIKNAWKTPSIDLDTILIAIRIASYGAEMDFDTKCPHCETENNHALNLSNLLGTIQCPDYSTPIVVGELSIIVKPQYYFNLNKKNMLAYEEQRLLEAINKEGTADELRTTQINSSMKKLLDISIDTIVDSTASITINNDVTVSDPKHIKDFFEHANGQVIRQIQKRLGEINIESQIANQKITCTNIECQKEFQTPVEFDYANFFAVGS
jgi:hypothetical protein